MLVKSRINPVQKMSQDFKDHFRLKSLDEFHVCFACLRLDVDDTLYPVSSGFSDHRNGEVWANDLETLCLVRAFWNLVDGHNDLSQL